MIQREHAADETAHDVGAEREPCGIIVLAGTLEAGAIEKRAEREHIAAVLELPEESLSRKQRRIPWLLGAMV
jgi:hypothetical protein